MIDVGLSKFGLDSWIKFCTVLMFVALKTFSRRATRCARVMRNDFSTRKCSRSIFGVRRVPIGSTRTVRVGIVRPPRKDTVRAYGVPLRCSKFADT